MSTSSVPKRATRDATAQEKAILDKLAELYSSRPTDECYSIFAEGAVFEDPFIAAVGDKQIREQYNGIAKLFAKSEAFDRVVYDAPEFTKGFLFDQRVSYFFSKTGKPFKTVDGKLTIELDAEGKITRLVDEWGKRTEPDTPKGILGELGYKWKRMTAILSGPILPTDPRKVYNPPTTDRPNA